MVRAAYILFLPLLVAFSGGSRSVPEKLNLVTDGMKNVTQSPIIGLELSASTVTCEPTYGFLPCTTVVWGELFLIVVYEFLLSLGEQYVSAGSDLFFQIFGTGIFGASLFHILGSIPEVAMILVTGLSGSTDTAESMATMSMAMLAGSAVMQLTVIWGYGVRTDDATRYTARIMILSMIPFLILQLAKLINSSSGIRVVILISLLVTLVFLFLYCFYQVFQPWIQERRLAYVLRNFVKNNLVASLLTAAGEPDESRIREVFHEIDQNKDASISDAELRAFLLGIKLEEAGLRNEDFVEKVMEDFDASGNAQIDETEFHRGISKWLYEANHPDNNQYDERPKLFSRSAQSEEQQSLLAKKAKQQSQTAQNSWFNYFKAAFLLIIGTAVMSLLAQPLIQTINEFSSAVNIPSFIISYVIIPVAMSYRETLGAIKSARLKTKQAISLTFSECSCKNDKKLIAHLPFETVFLQIYNAVFMNNMMGLAMFLLLVYIRDLSWDVSAEILVVLIICTLMGLLTSCSTKFPIWTAIIAYLMYPISLGLLYVLTEVLGWS
ncbi:Sodium/calcium exchanger NCL2 [Vitis vinifera]|uniref:Sodium/calcium exchanger NCL2 n=1 Tax=Vitis vinifera TaxID=29760 RepID=A0A438H3Q7_VITVI|nr:Sodium/calcium exchanger NCL2 [Vitis vinifera]